MPSILTHGFLADDFLSKHQGDGGFLAENPDAFRVGAQGPDPLFYLGLSPFRDFHPNLARRRIGSRIHRSDGRALFASLCDSVSYLDSPGEIRLASAFGLGQLAHYLLDSTAHPYVYYWTGFDRDGHLSGPYHYRHAHFEAQIDSVLARRRSASAYLKHPDRMLVIENDDLAFLSPIYARAVSSVIGEPVSEDIYSRSVISMAGTYRFVHGGSLRRGFFGKSALGQILIPSSAPSEVMNDGHMPWKDPYSGQKRREGFGELYQQALEKLDEAYADIIAYGFVGKAVLPSLSGFNYNGTPANAVMKYRDDRDSLIRR